MDALGPLLRLPWLRLRSHTGHVLQPPLVPALRLARFFRTTAQYWMDLQTAYDLAVAEALAGEQINREVQPALTGGDSVALAA